MKISLLLLSVRYETEFSFRFINQSTQMLVPFNYIRSVAKLHRMNWLCRPPSWPKLNVLCLVFPLLFPCPLKLFSMHQTATRFFFRNDDVFYFCSLIISELLLANKRSRSILGSIIYWNRSMSLFCPQITQQGHASFICWRFLIIDYLTL